MLTAALVFFAGFHADDVCAQPPTGPAKQSFVPADQMEAIFERSPNGVLLPREEFQQLLQKAQQAEAGNSSAPVSIVHRSATYDVQQQDKHAVVRLSLEMEQFADEWLLVKIPVGNLQVESATIADQPAIVGTEADQPGFLYLAHREPGRFVLELTLSTPLGTVGSDRVAAFRTMSAIATTLKVACPENRQLQLNDLKLNRPAPIDQATEYVIPAGNFEQVRLQWTSRQQQADSQTLVFARTDAQLQLSSDDIRWTSSTRVSVFGTAINQLVARVPARLEVTAVDSAGLESWKLEDDPEAPGATRVVMNYRQPFTEDRVVRLTAVAAIADDGSAAKLPTLQLVNVTSHTGRLYVQHEDQLRLMANAGSGIRHLGTNTTSNGPTAGEIFDFWLQNFELAVAVKPRGRQLFAEVNSSLSIVDTLAEFRCDTTVETMNAPLFELVLQLPSGWQTAAITGEDNAPLKWRNANAADQIVVEPPAPVAAGGLFSVTVKLSKLIADPAELQSVELPVVVVQDGLLVGGTYEVSGATDLAVSPVEINGLSPIGADEGKVLFETQGTTYSGKVTVARKPVRLSSRSVIRSRMDTRQKTVEAVVTADVLNGTTRTLQLEVSEDLGEELRFSVVSITKVPGCEDQQAPSALAIVEQSPESVVNGVRRFHLTFDKRFVGAVTLKTTVQQLVSEETVLSAPFLGVVGAIRQHGLVVFEAYPEQQLTAASDIETSGLQVADAGLVEPAPVASGRRVALVYRYVQPTYSLQVKEDRFDTEVVPSAVCEQMANISVLSDTGTIQRSCKTTFRCVGVQTLRFTLPDGEQSYLWSTILDGDAVEVRRDEGDYLVAIPTNSSQSQHELEILFETAAGEQSLLGKTDQQSIALSIDSEQGQASPIDVLQQTWDLRYPATAMLLNHTGGFSPQGSLEQPGWLHQAASMLQMPNSTVVATRGFPVVMIFLILFVVTALVVRRRWKTLVCVCLLGLLAMPLTLGTSALLTDQRVASRENKTAMDVAEGMKAAPGDIRLGEDLAGGTNMIYDMEPEAGAPSSGGGYGGAGFGGMGGGGMGGGGMGGGGMGSPPGQPDFNASQNGLFDEMNIINAPRDDFSGQSVGLRAPIAIQGNTIGGNQIQSNGDDGIPVSPSGQNIDLNGVVFDMENKPAKPAGSARLSVRAEIANPNDYKTMQFRSIGATQAAGQLQVTVQPRSRMNAIRISIAAVIALLCLAMSCVRVTRKIGFAVFLMLVAMAAVPLVPNEWQPAVDGVMCGVGVGILIWLSLGVCRKLQQWCECCRSGKCFAFLRSKPVKTAGLLIAVSTLATSVRGDEVEKLTRPEVVMPYTPGQPELMADRVFLPQDEFLKLYQLAYPETMAAETSVSPNQVVAAFYKSTDRRQIQDAKWSQSFQARYVIRSFSSQPVEVNLPIGSVAVISAKLNDADAVLLANASTPEPANVGVVQQQAIPQQRAEQQQLFRPDALPAVASAYRVRIPSEGVYLLDVVFEVSATIENSVGKLTLPLRPVAAGTIMFELPGDKVEARVNGRSNAFRADGAVLTVPIASANATTIEWKPTTTQATSDTIFHAVGNSALVMDDRGLVLQSALAIDCRQGQISEVQVTIPSDYAVRTVEGADIAGWNIGDGDSTKLTALFKQPIDGKTEIQLTLFRKAAFTSEDLRVEVPVPVVIGASRDSGSVTVLAGRELEVRVDSLSGVSQVNATDVVLPEWVDKTLRKVLAWRYTRHPVAVSVRVSRTAEKLNITSLNGVQLEQQRQLWTTLISAKISGAPRRRLEIELPADYVALDVAANDMADWYYSTSPNESSNTRILNIQFQSAKLGTANVVIQGQTSRTQDEFAAKLVAPAVVGADESLTSVSVWLDASSEIATATAEGWKRIGRDTAIDARILKLQADAPDISFNNDNVSLNPIALALRRAEASLSGESVTVTAVTDTSIELTLALKWKISGAATRSVSFTLPTELTDVYDFQVPGLRQLQKTVDGDLVKVTVHLQQPVRESLFVLGTGTLPLPDSQQVVPQTPQFVVDDDGVNKVASQSHFWVVVNQSVGLLEAVDAATDGKDVAAEEIKTNIPQQLLQQAVAIRRLRSDRSNSAWQMKFPERQKVAPAVVALAAHVTVVAEDSTWRSVHTLQIRNESRQFLPVVLPVDSRVLFCLVKGQPTRIVTRKQNDRLLHLIPIPQSGAISAPFDVQFAIAGQLPALSLDFAGDALQVPCPVIPEYRDDSEYGVTISRNTWQVYVPEEWQASIDNDPRQTNVIAATAEDLADVRLMGSVENMKSMISAANTKGGGNNEIVLYRELQRQQLELQDVLGNDIQAESQRSQVLSEAESLLQQRFGSGSQSGAQGDFESPFPGGSKLLFGSNIYLDQQEALQNGFNNTNRMQIIMDNSPSGQFSSPGEVAVDKSTSLDFNFVLPEAAVDSDDVSKNRRPSKKALSQKSKEDAAAMKGGNSKLLERRLSNQLQSLQNLELNSSGGGQQGGAFVGSAPSFGSRQLAFPNAPNTVPLNTTTSEGLRNDVSVQQMQDLGIVVLKGSEADVAEAAAVIAQLERQQSVAGKNDGLLSLQFTIPEGGVRHDFVRTGGNANLSLKVRSRQAVGMGIGIAWAVLCVVLAILLLRGASKGASSLLLRAFVLVSLGALIGAFCTPAAIRDVCLAVCVVAAVCASGMIIVRSFSKPTANF